MQICGVLREKPHPDRNLCWTSYLRERSAMSKRISSYDLSVYRATLLGYSGIDNGITNPPFYSERAERECLLFIYHFKSILIENSE